ncbi:hypothetical protein M405DRAFT_830254 [Rhizopogon salebrosus TDB-379]|nr:hypothetical protein M405DRAFT_830254 [Rhizopogon salebrosus TDB-379]
MFSSARLSPMFIILYISSGTDAQRVPGIEFSYYARFELLLAHLASCSANLASSERLRSLYASAYKEDESGIGEPDMGRGHSGVLRHRSLMIILPLQTQAPIRSCPTMTRGRDIYPDTPGERSSLYSYLLLPVAEVCQHSFVTRMPIYRRLCGYCTITLMHVYRHRLLHNDVNACAMIAVLPLCFLRSRLDALSRSAISYAYVHIRF